MKLSGTQESLVMSPEDQRDITVPSTLLRPAAITLLNPEYPLSSTKKYFKKIPSYLNTSHEATVFLSK
jgi:hypothetical protein